MEAKVKVYVSWEHGVWVDLTSEAAKEAVVEYLENFVIEPEIFIGYCRNNGVKCGYLRPELLPQNTLTGAEKGIKNALVR